MNNELVLCTGSCNKRKKGKHGWRLPMMATITRIHCLDHCISVPTSVPVPTDGCQSVHTKLMEWEHTYIPTPYSSSPIGVLLPYVSVWSHDHSFHVSLLPVLPTTMTASFCPLLNPLRALLSLPSFSQALVLVFLSLLELLCQYPPLFLPCLHWNSLEALLHNILLLPWNCHPFN